MQLSVHAYASGTKGCSPLNAEIDAGSCGCRGSHKQLMVGAGYTEREVCDGQGLSSPGRWSQEDRLYPSSSLWLQMQRMIFHTAETMTSSCHGFVRSTQDRRESAVSHPSFFSWLSGGQDVCVRFRSPRREQSFPDELIIALFTDYRGSRLIKLIASRYPLSALLKNFSEQFLHTGIRPGVGWSPRETNPAKDRLANGDSTCFSPSLRVRVFPLRPPW